MKYSKLMKERVRRVGVLLRELGYEMLDGEFLEQAAANSSAGRFNRAVLARSDTCPH